MYDSLIITVLILTGISVMVTQLLETGLVDHSTIEFQSFIKEQP